MEVCSAVIACVILRWSSFDISDNLYILTMFLDNDIANDVEVFIDFTSLQAMLTIFAKVSEKAFMLFPLHGKCFRSCQCSWSFTVLSCC